MALLFMAMLAAVNLRGVGESVKLNVGLTIIEISGLLLVILVGLWAFTGGGADVDFSRVVAFDTATDKNAFMAVTAATSLAFFAMVGFEDSVNMAEETKDPVRVFPKALLTGLSIAGVVYVRRGHRRGGAGADRRAGGQRHPTGRGGQGRGPGPADRRHPAVHLDVRGVQHRADQHVDGQQVDLRHGPPACTAARFGRVRPTRRTPWVAIMFTTTIAFGLIFYVTAFANSTAISLLGGTTSLLLLAVFAMVNVAVLVLRRDVQAGGRAFQNADGAADHRLRWHRCIW